MMQITAVFQEMAPVSGHLESRRRREYENKGEPVPFILVGHTLTCEISASEMGVGALMLSAQGIGILPADSSSKTILKILNSTFQLPGQTTLSKIIRPSWEREGAVIRAYHAEVRKAMKLGGILQNSGPNISSRIMIEVKEVE